MRKSPHTAVAALREISGLALVLACTWVSLVVIGSLALASLQSFGADPLIGRLQDQVAGLALLPTVGVALLAFFQD